MSKDTEKVFEGSSLKVISRRTQWKLNAAMIGGIDILLLIPCNLMLHVPSPVGVPNLGTLDQGFNKILMRKRNAQRAKRLAELHFTTQTEVVARNDLIQFQSLLEMLPCDADT